MKNDVPVSQIFQILIFQISHILQILSATIRLFLIEISRILQGHLRNTEQRNVRFYEIIENSQKEANP